MKYFITILLISICVAANAQQESKFYIRMNMADTNDLYFIYFEKFASNNTKTVPFGKSVSIKSMQQIKFDEKDITTADNIDYDAERKWYSFGNTDSMFGSIVLVSIKLKSTKKKMYIILPVNTNAKWTEIYLQDIEFKPGKVIDILKHTGRFDREDNTVKIIVNKMVKNNATTKSSFKIPNVSFAPQESEFKRPKR